MAANVTMYAGVLTAWWMNEKTGGMVVPEGLGTLEVARRSKLVDVDYSTAPVFAILPDGTKINIDNRRAIVRGAVPETDAVATGTAGDGADKSGPEVLEVVSNRYNLQTPNYYVRALDRISNESADNQWPVETMGLLRGGRKLFVSLAMGEDTLFDDPRERSQVSCFLGVDFTGRGSATLKTVYTQVVCENTWLRAMNEDNIAISIPHNASASDLFEVAVNIQRAAHESQDEFRAAAEQMAGIIVTEKMARQVVEATYPEPRSPHEPRQNKNGTYTPSRASIAKTRDDLDKLEHRYDLALKRMYQRRSLALETWERYIDERAFGNSAYGFNGAMIDTIQHREGRGDVFASLISGGERQKEMTRAHKALMEVIK